jgi:CheY-like chemotaxis protein
MDNGLSPILIVEDDKDDLDLIQECVAYLKIERPVFYFNSGGELEEYLKKTPVAPFLILCDLNLPQSDGFDIRLRIARDEELKYKSVPFIFWSTSATEKQLQHGYDLPAQGFFFKPHTFQELCDTFRIIIEYWTCSRHPKSVV